MAPRPTLLGVCFLVAMATVPLARAEEASPALLEGIIRSLEDLRSPAERTRRLAVRRLIADLPASRGPVLDALAEAPPALKVHLVEVLAADGTLPAIRALLQEMNLGDEILAVRIRRILVRDERATRRVLEAWAEDPDLRVDAPGTVTQRTLDLEHLLRRAEAERLFVSRKSRTGSTGSYRGQYDVLKPYRAEALEICVGLLTDRALPEPGVPTVGGFSFLRSSPIQIDVSELRSMAAHAFSELARSDDRGPLATLHQHLVRLESRVQDLEMSFDDIAFAVALNQYGDLVVALYLVREDLYLTLLEDLLTKLRRRSDWRRALSATYRPAVFLRVQRYAEAVSEFERILDWNLADSRAGTHYNLACAYAQWAEATEVEEVANRRCALALDHLEHAVRNRWSDIGWMEEDRDLEPIRDTDRYRALAVRVRKELDLPSDD